MGQASRSQQEVLQKLRDVEDLLRHNRESDSEMLVKKLKQAQDELQTLRDRQAALMQTMQDAGQIADAQERQQQLESLRQEQKKLQDETARLSRRLARLEARKAATSTDRAAARMEQSQDRLDEADNSGAARQQQEALDDLEQAQRELAARRRQEEETLAREQLAKIADELAVLIPRQQAASNETKRLNDLHESTGKWPRPQLASLRDLTQAQRDLAQGTGRIAEKISAAEVFALALKGAVAHMRRAADRLAERQTGAEAQSPQEAARKRLQDLVDALKPEPPEPTDGKPAPDQEGGGSGGQNEGPPTDGIPTLAQIKMLISLQKELSLRTSQIEQLRGKDGRLPATAREELESIATEQGELADLVRNLSSAAADEDDHEARNGEDKKQSNTSEARE
jgi:DNA repair exonuclease SbcCD ATPase subunit